VPGSARLATAIPECNDYSVSDDNESEFDALLDRVLIGGREKRVIVIVDYDPSWPKRFEAQRERIIKALGPALLRIEHIGSTSVPGLAAKPIIDILVSVADVELEAAYAQHLEAVGYILRVREQSHRMFRTADLAVHIHVWDAGGVDERRHILLRDWLRRDLADRATYEKGKRNLAQREWADMNHYAQAKTEVIARIMEHAEAWATSSGWRP
jgi:GrpB-like predicted nucleotidyltransferase (UPF0157 family)